MKVKNKNYAQGHEYELECLTHRGMVRAVVTSGDCIGESTLMSIFDNDTLVFVDNRWVQLNVAISSELVEIPMGQIKALK